MSDEREFGPSLENNEQLPQPKVSGWLGAIGRVVKQLLTPKPGK